MAALVRALWSNNAHFFNLALLSAAVLVPVLLFAERNTPTSSELEAVLVRWGARRAGAGIVCAL